MYDFDIANSFKRSTNDALISDDTCSCRPTTQQPYADPHEAQWADKLHRHE